jgi:hypothetical protein
MEKEISDEVPNSGQWGGEDFIKKSILHIRFESHTNLRIPLRISETKMLNK